MCRSDCWNSDWMDPLQYASKGMTPKLTAIKKLCQHVLELDKSASWSPWKFVDCTDVDVETAADCWEIETPVGMLDGRNLKADSELIALTRNIGPAMANAIINVMWECEDCKDDCPSLAVWILTTISDSFSDEILKPYYE